MIESLTKLLNSLKFLNWVKLAELSVLIVILIVGVAFYENRQYIYESVGANSLTGYYPMLRVGEKSREEMTEIVNRSPAILGLQVVEVNFVKNERKTLFFESDDPQLKKLFDKYFSTKITDPPALSSIEQDNSRVVRIVNGEFVCLPYKDTIAYTMIGPSDNVGQVCSIAVPPIYGKFRGYITAFVARDLRPAELSQVKFVLQNISLNIFEGK